MWKLLVAVHQRIAGFVAMKSTSAMEPAGTLMTSFINPLFIRGSHLLGGHVVDDLAPVCCGVTLIVPDVGAVAIAAGFLDERLTLTVGKGNLDP